MRDRPSIRIGLIVNPIAGMGGAIALKGTDGRAAQEAIGRGVTPRAGARAERALRRLLPLGDAVEVLGAPGAMGTHAAEAAGLRVTPLGPPPERDTTAADTQAAARAVLARGADLLLVAGGDGTLRDVWSVVGTQLPLVGIPTGVKMHSGAFATTPEAAGDTALGFVSRPRGLATTREAEVADALPGILGPHLYGRVLVPADAPRIVGAKAATVRQDDAALDALARRIAREMRPGEVYLIGPGTTTQRVLRALDLDGTLLGVDAVRDRTLIGTDLDEDTLLRLVVPGRTTIIAGVVGGQGFLFGRGNQQISAAVLRAVGLDRVSVLADAGKLRALDPPVLRVDTGDPDLDRQLSGYRPVAVGPRTQTVIRIST